MTNGKRTFERLVFPKEKEIRALFVSAHDIKSEVEARVLNISPGGIGLAAVKDKQHNLIEEEEFILQYIKGEEGLFCLQGQIVKVKWILNHEVFDNYGFGCEFINLSRECFEILLALCEAERERI